jgi:hypothetical protein
MMNKSRQLPTLDRLAAYEIRVPGEIRTGWASWAKEMTVTIEREGGDPPITAMTGSFDQAALLGLLRRLYSLGVPLISVNWIDEAGETDLEPDT